MKNIRFRDKIRKHVFCVSKLRIKRYVNSAALQYTRPMCGDRT